MDVSKPRLTEMSQVASLRKIIVCLLQARVAAPPSKRYGLIGTSLRRCYIDLALLPQAALINKPELTQLRLKWLRGRNEIMYDSLLDDSTESLYQSHVDFTNDMIGDYIAVLPLLLEVALL